MSERLIPVEGTYNFRELGGFRAGESETRMGVLFRSDALHALTDRGRDQVAELGVERAVDLRDDAERRRGPDRLPRGAAVIPNPIFPDAQAHVDANLDIFQLTELIYLQHADTVTEAVVRLAEPGAGATVFHCTAGKDRTGAVAAITLLAVGVSRDDVVSDYAESERHLSGSWLDAHLAALEGFGVAVTPEVQALVGQTPVAAIERALADVEREYGSARDYLVAHGAPGSVVERLEERLLG